MSHVGKAALLLGNTKTAKHAEFFTKREASHNMISLARSFSLSKEGSCYFMQLCMRTVAISSIINNKIQIAVHIAPVTPLKEREAMAIFR